ncbi:MAG: prepilin-type N-terminal cleavage/methylation domain-containing protein [Sedimentisphaerales bacterium]|nr:prepilin-type N-terminal cleavage/methylation domain-containing protein [Sedimentisphaerales bacterium]
MKTGIRHRNRAGGFTLIEGIIAMMIIGLTIAAIVASNAAFSRANGVGIDLSTAEFLIEQIREMTASLPVIDPQSGTATFGSEEASLAAYDDLDDFDGAVFSPPVDISRASLADFAGFSQRITVENVSINNLTSVVADHSSDFVRVRVDILMNGQVLSSCNWIRVRL